MDVKEQAKSAAKGVVAVGISTAAMALVRWIASRPIKRAIARRRKERAEEESERGDTQ